MPQTPDVPPVRHKKPGQPWAKLSKPKPGPQAGAKEEARQAGKKFGLLCQCGGETEVMDSRPITGSIRRRRKCHQCGARFTTYERSESMESALPPRALWHLRELKKQLDEILPAELTAQNKELP